MKYLINIALLFCLSPLLLFGQTANNKQFAPLQKASKKTNSTGVVVLQDGETVFDYHEGASHEMMNTMSMTKSVVGLAFAKLFSDGQIDSLDTPVAHYYPEWRQGQKEEITIRHLLNQTSGLQNVASTRVEVYPSPDVVQLALCASVVDAPGSKWSYNNKAVNLLSGIVKKVTDEPIDDYLGRTLFKPLGINEYRWRTDEAGNHYAMSGLMLRPTDMAKLGQLVHQGGYWDGKQIISKRWINEMLSKSTPSKKTYGLLWYRVFQNSNLVVGDDLIADLKEAEIDEKWIKKVQAIKGTYKNRGQLTDAYMSQFSKAEFLQFRKVASKAEIGLLRGSNSGPVIGYEARGYLGQTLVIYPELDIVAVRMVKPSNDYNQKTDSFGSFSDLVHKLATQNGSG